MQYPYSVYLSPKDHAALSEHDSKGLTCNLLSIASQVELDGQICVFFESYDGIAEWSHHVERSIGAGSFGVGLPEHLKTALWCLYDTVEA